MNAHLLQSSDILFYDFLFLNLLSNSLHDIVSNEFLISLFHYDPVIIFTVRQLLCLFFVLELPMHFYKLSKLNCGSVVDVDLELHLSMICVLVL